MKNNRNKRTILISTLLILISIFIIHYELKAHTPIDIDENKIVKQISPGELNKKVKERLKKEKEAKEEKQKIYTVLNFENNKGKKYDSLFRNLYIEENIESPDLFTTLAPGPVDAWEVDLNDDGIDEIIGFVCNANFYGQIRKLYILQKTKSGYRQLNYYLGHLPGVPIIVYKTKTNGYHDIKLHADKDIKDKDTVDYIVKYAYGFYLDEEDQEFFKKRKGKGK